jgi:hypothetical protein
MAHYDIFRDQLGIKYPAFGHALWEPNPEDSSLPWRLATWASFAKANSTAYLMHFFLKTIHLIKDSECQNIMNRFGLALKIILALECWLHVISARVALQLYLVT